MRGTEVSEIIDLAYTWQERATEAEAEAADWREVAKQHMEKVCKLEAEVERLKLMVTSITEGLDEAIETNHYLEKIIDGLNADLRIVATDESTEGYPCICSICELACKCPDEKRDPYSNKDSLCKFVWKTLAELDKEGER